MYIIACDVTFLSYYPITSCALTHPPLHPPPSTQVTRRSKLEEDVRSKKQEAAKCSREVSVLDRRVRETGGRLGALKGDYLKAQQETIHHMQRLEATK